MSRRKSKKTKNTSLIINVLVAVFVLLFAGIIGIVSYKSGFSDGKKYVENKHTKEQDKLVKKITSIAAPKNDLVGKLQNVLAKERMKGEVNPNHEFDASPLGRPPKGPKREVSKTKIYSNFKKPRLAIIIDDVSFAHDVKSIKALKIPLTMSFLPPTKIHPNSAKLASREKIYMVHLPLEAMNFKAEETTTLRASDSREKINRRVLEIKKLFPRAYYVNNHTGSKFTADERAVKNLIVSLNRQGIGFLDSRTTSKTKVPQVMKSLGKKYIARDIFLDHESDIHYIQNQILKAIKKAKEHGFAIAIGHPRKDTLQALKNSKKILKSVELVYINKVI